MNWGKVKWVMIAILAAACLLLGWNIYSVSSRRNYIDDQTLTNLTTILETDGIYLAEDAIPRERFTADVLAGELSDDYYQFVYKTLCGDPIYRTYTTPNGLMIFNEIGDRYHVRKYFGFSYHAAGYLSVQLPSYTDLADEHPDKGVDKNMEKQCLAAIESFLKLQSFMPEETADRFRLVLTGYSSVAEGQGVYASATLEIDGVPLCTNEAVFLISEGEVLIMEGNWTFLFSTRSERALIYDQVNILISEKKNIDEDRRLGVMSGAVSIRRAEPCYCPYVDEESGTVYFVPGWRIIHEDGRIRIYNGVSNLIYPLESLIDPS